MGRPRPRCRRATGARRRGSRPRAREEGGRGARCRATPDPSEAPPGEVGFRGDAGRARLLGAGAFIGAGGYPDGDAVVVVLGVYWHRLREVGVVLEAGAGPHAPGLGVDIEVIDLGADVPAHAAVQVP